MFGLMLRINGRKIEFEIYGFSETKSVQMLDENLDAALVAL